MRIVYKAEKQQPTLREIEVGQCFMHDESLFMKTISDKVFGVELRHCVINMANGDVHFWSEDLPVTPVCAEIVIL
jgi:hypothetical protein